MRSNNHPGNRPSREPSFAADAPLRIGVVTNPHSRQNRARPDGAITANHILFEERTQSPDDVHAAVDRLLARGVQALAINGGDGTIGHVIASLVEHGRTELPLIAVCGGTNNSVAKDTRSLGDIVEVEDALRACDSLRNCARVLRQTLHVTVRSKAGQERALGYGFIFASGLVARLSDAYYAGPWHGPAQAARVMLTKLPPALIPGGANAPFFRFEPNQVALDGQALRLPDGAQLTFASTIDTQILFFAPFRDSARDLVDKASFNALVNAMPMRTILAHLWPLARGGWSAEDDRHRVAPAQQMTVSGTRRVFLDGELFDIDPADEVHIVPGPKVQFVLVR